MKRLLILYILVNLVSFFGLAVPDEPAQLSGARCSEVLQEMSRKLSVNKSLSARFLQERHLVMFGDVLRSEGFLYYLAPGKIRWEFVKPYASLTIMQESGEVEKYDIIDGRAVRIETGARKVLAEVLTQIVNWQKGNLDQANDEFRLSMYKKDTGFKLVLTPLSRSVAKILAQIEFEIDGTSFLVHSVSLRENENDYTVIRFSEQEFNRKLPDELFNLEKPLLINTKK